MTHVLLFVDMELPTAVGPKA